MEERRSEGDAGRLARWLFLTAAASLQDGTLLLLERRFTLLEGVRMRLRRIEASDIKPGALLDGEVLIEADLSDEIDNMEASPFTRQRTAIPS